MVRIVSRLLILFLHISVLSYFWVLFLPNLKNQLVECRTIDSYKVSSFDDSIYYLTLECLNNSKFLDLEVDLKTFIKNKEYGSLDKYELDRRYFISSSRKNTEICYFLILLSWTVLVVCHLVFVYYENSNTIKHGNYSNYL